MRDVKCVVLAAASLALSGGATSAQFCEADGTISFSVKPSLVAHSNEIMDTTFDDAGLVVVRQQNGSFRSNTQLARS